MSLLINPFVIVLLAVSVLSGCSGKNPPEKITIPEIKKERPGQNRAKEILIIILEDIVGD